MPDDTPSSVDMTGDLSRTAFNDRIRHVAEVGKPIGGASYRPDRNQQHEAEGSNINPLKCAIVLGTPDASGKTEFRIGRLSDTHGMWEAVDPNGKSRTAAQKLRVNYVRACFGDSPVYTNREEALAATLHKYPNNTGAKVMIRTFAFPQ